MNIELISKLKIFHYKIQDYFLHFVFNILIILKNPSNSTHAENEGEREKEGGKLKIFHYKVQDYSLPFVF